MKIELQEYKYVEHSHFGFLWVTIAEFDSQEDADEAKAYFVKEQGRSKYDFRTNIKVNTPKRSQSPSFSFKAAKIDIKHSERRSRWNSNDARELATLTHNDKIHERIKRR